MSAPGYPTSIEAGVYTCHPGEVIAEWLDEHGRTQVWLAAKTGLTTKHISQIVRGYVPVSATVAVKIGRVTKMSPYVLARMQSDYDVKRASRRKRS